MNLKYFVSVTFYQMVCNAALIINFISVLFFFASCTQARAALCLLSSADERLFQKFMAYTVTLRTKRLIMTAITTAARAFPSICSLRLCDQKLSPSKL